MTTGRRGPSGPPGRAPHGAGADGSRALLRNRDFQALWTSRFLAGLGKECGAVAYPLLVLVLAGSAAQAGAIGAAQVTAAMVCAVLGGDLADRTNRRAVLLGCDLGRLALLTVFTVLLLTGHASIPLIACVAVASAAMTGIANPVATAATKQLVPAAQFADAAAQNQVRLFGSTALGAPVAGALFNLARALPFAVEALTYLVSAVLLLAVRRPMQADRTEADEWTLRGVVDGFALLARHPVLRPMIAWILGFNLVFTATGAFLAIIATAEGQGASHLQIGMTVSLAGTGGLAGSLAAGLVVRWARPSATFLVAAWSAPLGALTLLVAPNVVLLGVILGCVFAVVPSANALFYGYVAASVGDARQGRVLGAVVFLAMLSQPVGILGTGIVFDLAGPEWVFLTMALVSGAAALCTLTPVMRSLPRPEEVSVA